MTLFSPDEKRGVKQIVKFATKNGSQPLTRIVHSAASSKWLAKIKEFEQPIRRIVHDERVEKELRLAEVELLKASNLRDFHQEIMSRPKKQWMGKATTSSTTVNPSQQEEKALLAKIEKAEPQNNEEDNEDEFGDERSDVEMAGAGSLDESGDEQSVDGELDKKKTKMPIGTDLKVNEKSAEKKKVKSKKDEKNRLQKGAQNDARRRWTTKERSKFVDERAAKAIGRRVKRASFVTRNQRTEGNSDDDESGRKRAKKVKKKRKGLKQQTQEISQPQKLTRKMRAAKKRYAERMKKSEK